MIVKHAYICHLVHDEVAWRTCDTSFSTSFTNFTSNSFWHGRIVYDGRHTHIISNQSDSTLSHAMQAQKQSVVWAWCDSSSFCLCWQHNLLHTDRTTIRAFQFQRSSNCPMASENQLTWYYILNKAKTRHVMLQCLYAHVSCAIDGSKISHHHTTQHIIGVDNSPRVGYNRSDIDMLTRYKAAMSSRYKSLLKDHL